MSRDLVSAQPATLLNVMLALCRISPSSVCNASRKALAASAYSEQPLKIFSESKSPLSCDLSRPSVPRLGNRMGVKRKATGEEASTSKAAKASVLVNAKRVRELKGGAIGSGPVMYWMSRDQRMKDNWALLYAAERAAAKGARVVVVFNLVDKYLHAGARQFGFMLRGLQELCPKLEAANIRFHLVQGEPPRTIPKLVKELGVALLVCDQSPVRMAQKWRADVRAAVKCPFHEVDAHNVVPVWVASDKREYAARTIRTKIHKHLPEFFESFPELPACEAWQSEAPAIAWADIIANALELGKEVPEVDIAPGEDAAWQALCGKDGFLTPDRLNLYAEKRNDPNVPKALSGLSPYFHFGQLSVQRAALEAVKHKATADASVKSFLEEAIVRRELSDNFCFYVEDYDSLSCAYDWAKNSLELHKGDKREHLYTLDELEKSKTHDDLWNAAQSEMVHFGKMHGFLRMYWAKKILEWTASPEQALEFAIFLNDKYEIDGRDPNGYVGCMWSICGIHDQGWAERAVFGKIRYMNYKGCQRKFDVKAYVANVAKQVATIRKPAKK